MIDNLQDIKYAKKLDSNDSLSDFRDQFFYPKFKSDQSYIYFSGNSLGLQPKTTKKFVNRELDDWKNLGVDGHINSTNPWFSYHELLTPLSAEIVGALDKEVVVMNSLTVNIHLLMISFYRPKGKRKKILIEENAFPSDKYVVQSQIKYHGNDPINDLILIKPDRNNFISCNTISEYLEKYGEEIALVMLGGVNYYTGQALDMKFITDKAQDYGCVVGFDLAHAAGNLQLNLHEWGIDFASWCGYKYLNGGPGAPSGIFIHERHLNKNNYPRLEGWWGHEKDTRFKMLDNFIPIQTAEAWQLSNPPILSMAALFSSLEIFHSAGIKNLRRKSEKLTMYLESLIKYSLNDKIEIITPSLKEYRGCQLSLKLLHPFHDIVKHLKSQGIICDWREPDVIRIAPVPLYNSFEDCYNFVKRLKNIISEYN